MFLYHGITNYVAVHLLAQRSKLIVAPVAVLLAVALATTSYYLVEIRFLRLKAKFIGRSIRLPRAISTWKYRLTPAGSK
jgi:peptidoglycan/LPS O-acetylase OafA/YrhL